MHIATHGVSQNASQEEIKSALLTLKTDLGREADLIILYITETMNLVSIQKTVQATFPKAKLITSTSCQGVVTQEGFHSGASFWALSDPEGSYGVGIAPADLDFTQATEYAIERALEDANREGEVPELVWIHASPGQEETILQTICDQFGKETPVAGGSCADDTISGNWMLSDGNTIIQEGVAIAAFFPSKSIHYAFQSGYQPTTTKGTVTKSLEREILEIDGQPASHIYNEWIQNGISEDKIASGGTIMEETALFPIGRKEDTLNPHDTPTQEFVHYTLSHPVSTTSNGGMTLFSEIPEGTEITMMTGSSETIAERAGRVAHEAIERDIATQGKTIAGGLVIYCAGCMMMVKPDMGNVISSLNQAFNGQPFAGAFTFGEQGRFIGGENRHGNLMISVIVFEGA